MPNWETDSADEYDFYEHRHVPPRQTIDTCGHCFAETDTTGDPEPECPRCGSTYWFQVRELPDTCPYAQRDCAGPKSSVAVHICTACLDLVAVHERAPRAELHCLCAACDPYMSLTKVRGYNPQKPKPPDPVAPKPKNPFDDDIDDWL